jgi:hypothetical protein
MSDNDRELIAWVYSTGYPYDFTTAKPLPEKYRWPLVHYAYEQEYGDLAADSVPETPQDWYDTMADEGGWDA